MSRATFRKRVRTGELSTTAAQMASGAEETTNQSATVASAAEEMTANMKNISVSTDQMSNNVRSVAAAVEEMTAITSSSVISGTTFSAIRFMFGVSKPRTF